MIACEKCKKEITDGEQFIRLRPDREVRSMTLFHYGACAPPDAGKVRAMTPALRQAIEAY